MFIPSWYLVNMIFLQIDWGEASMIEAERILLRHALDDPLNDRFVFLSDRWGYNFVNNHKLQSLYKYSPFTIGIFMVSFRKETRTELFIKFGKIEPNHQEFSPNRTKLLCRFSVPVMWFRTKLIFFEPNDSLWGLLEKKRKTEPNRILELFWKNNKLSWTVKQNW